MGILIALVSYVLEPISAFLHNRKRRSPYAHLEWTAIATLQLQRLAYEEANPGTWSKGTDTIPTTAPDELLSGLDNTDLKHPVIQRLREKHLSSVQPQYLSEATEGIPTQSDPTESITIGNTHRIEEDTQTRTESSIKSPEEATSIHQMAVEPQASDVDLPLANYGAVDVGIGLDQVRDLSTEAAVATKEQRNSLEKLAACSNPCNKSRPKTKKMLTSAVKKASTIYLIPRG